MRVGFGLWMDNDSKKRPWDTSNFTNNYFQPDTWQDAIHFSLSASDEYVWVYCERFNWWTGQSLPPAYESAQFAGRDKAANTHIAYPSAVPQRFIKHAPATRIASTPDLLLDLTEEPWLFRIDPSDAGASEAWFDAPAHGRWSKIGICKFWGEQGWDYDGIAWYRTQFQMSDPPLRNVKLTFGAVDECGPGLAQWPATRWARPGRIRLGSDLLSGCHGQTRDGTNELVVRVLNRAGPGGIWRPVAFYRVAKVAGK